MQLEYVAAQNSCLSCRIYGMDIQLVSPKVKQIITSTVKLGEVATPD